MAKGAITAVLAGVLLGSSVCAEPPPSEIEQRMDFKGMALGATLAEMQAVAQLKCSPDRTQQFDTVCTYARPSDRTFAGRQADIRLGLFSGRLDSAHLTFPAPNYTHLKTAMDDKFGEVTPNGRRAVSTYMMNGDRAYLFLADGSVVLIYQAAAGAPEREKRKADRPDPIRKDM